jgi:DNA-binding CsgD family transcriptional regulator
LSQDHGATVHSEQGKQIAHIILSEVPWLHLADWPEDRGAKVPTLFPKQRIVFNLLLDGRDRKTIAAHMAISENTVAGYARDIYRHFGVNSQPRLIRRFFNPEAKV